MTLEVGLFVGMMVVILGLMAYEAHHPDALSRVVLSIPQGP